MVLLQKKKNPNKNTLKIWLLYFYYYFIIISYYLNFKSMFNVYNMSVYYKYV